MSRPSPRYDAVMFDLDGTLLDTLADIAGAGNHMLAQLGHAPLPTPRYRYLAGQGALYLVREALGPAHAHRAEEGLRIFKAYQLVHGLDQTQPYDGVPDMLDALAARGVKLAVLSNKPDKATQLAVSTKLPRWTFDAVLGHRDDAPLKPDPTTALAIARQMNVPPGRWAYLGDTAVDMQTARAAGFFTIGCTWGFRDEPELREHGAQAIVKHPREVLGFIG